MIESFKHVIKAKKQDNGIYGIPLCIIKIDNVFLKNIALYSAILCAFRERHNCTKMLVSLTSDNGFYLTIDDNSYNIKYENFKLVDDTLYYYSLARLKKISEILNTICS